MYKLLIIINAEIHQEGKTIVASQVTEKMVEAISMAASKAGVETEVVAAGSLWHNTEKPTQEIPVIYCPLTIQLPESLEFPAKPIYTACFDVKRIRHWVEKNLGYKTTTGNQGLGNLWLPIVLTQKGPIYGEVIGEGVIPNCYEQPIDLTEQQRKPLYHLAYSLLDHLAAPSAVYLLQFSCQKEKIIFDRLWPFPAAPAIASIKRQKPDLYTCHLSCLTGQPIQDLLILATSKK